MDRASDCESEGRGFEPRSRKWKGERFLSLFESLWWLRDKNMKRNFFADVIGPYKSHLRALKDSFIIYFFCHYHII